MIHHGPIWMGLLRLSPGIFIHNSLQSLDRMVQKNTMWCADGLQAETPC